MAALPYFLTRLSDPFDQKKATNKDTEQVGVIDSKVGLLIFLGTLRFLIVSPFHYFLLLYHKFYVLFQNLLQADLVMKIQNFLGSWLSNAPSFLL